MNRLVDDFCSYPLSILWTKGDATHISSKRSLALSNVDRRQEGTFVCTALVKRTNQKERTVYTLKIIGTVEPLAFCSFDFHDCVSCLASKGSRKSFEKRF